MTIDEAEKRIAELEAELLRYRTTDIAATAALRKQGLATGATGVTAAFGVWFFVYAVSSAYAFHHKQAMPGAPDAIHLGAVLCVALVVYFAFVFSFAIKANVSATGVNLEADKR